MGQNIIRVEKLSKSYQPGVKVVDDLSFDIQRGEIFGLLGPNGAGKTTTLSIMSGLLSITSGHVFIKEFSIESDFEKIKPFIGIVPQSIALYSSLTAGENLFFFGRMYGIDKKELKRRIREYMDLFLLGSNIDQRIDAFSEGMKRRVNMIAGLLHHPEIVFLDEPTAGVDVHSKRIILNHLVELNKNGTTLIYTSHHLSEAEKFCTYVAIIDKGKVVCQGAPAELLSSGNGYEDLESVFVNYTENKLAGA